MIELLGFRFSYRFVAFCYALLGVFSLAMAFTAEYAFGFLPCKLCFLQRWPYLIMIFLGLIAFTFHDKKKIYAPTLLAITACFAYGAYIAIYQTGGEQGWWLLTADCSSVLDSNLSPEEYLAAMKQQPAVPCDMVKWSMFGISMAGYNAMFSVFMGIFTLGMAIKVALTKELDLLV